MKRLVKIIIILAVLAGLGYGSYSMYEQYKPQPMQSLFTESTVTRGDILRTISATGTVEPQELINVGAQVNGKIMSFGTDSEGKTIDFGSKVTQGMILAQIDDVTYKADLQEALANEEQAKASITSAEATIKESEANAVLARNNFERAKTLLAQESMTQSDYDAAEAEFYSTQAQIAKAKAALEQAHASLSIAKAALDKSNRNLEYCTITSPVDGIIIDRRVSIGQTVVSNQTASSIFLVATDFSKMQVWVSVNEADIGSIAPGMPVIFSCDAFPGEVFRGELFRIRLNATLSSNVVTYIVEVNVDNANGRLVPYLTANVKFVREEHTHVLMLPNAALRFMPPENLIAKPAPELKENETLLWVKNDLALLEPVVVQTGITNGISTEILAGPLKENDTVVTAVEHILLTDEPGDTDELKNPFMPNMPKRTPRGSAGARVRAAERAKGGK